MNSIEKEPTFFPVLNTVGQNPDVGAAGIVNHERPVDVGEFKCSQIRPVNKVTESLQSCSRVRPRKKRQSNSQAESSWFVKDVLAFDKVVIPVPVRPTVLKGLLLLQHVEDARCLIDTDPEFLQNCYSIYLHLPSALSEVKLFCDSRSGSYGEQLLCVDIDLPDFSLDIADNAEGFNGIDSDGSHLPSNESGGFFGDSFDRSCKPGYPCLRHLRHRIAQAWPTSGHSTTADNCRL